jgi:hypothetical protein
VLLQTETMVGCRRHRNARIDALDERDPDVVNRPAVLGHVCDLGDFAQRLRRRQVNVWGGGGGAIACARLVSDCGLDWHAIAYARLVCGRGLDRRAIAFARLVSDRGLDRRKIAW